MNSFKQALNQIKAEWQNSLVLGVTATAFVFLAWVTPWISAFLISFGILIFQEIAQKLADSKTWPRELIVKNDLPAYLVISIILLPTSVLLGSSIGMLDNPQELLVTLPISLSLLILAFYFYFVLSQALRFHFEKKIGIAKSIDIVGLASVKNFRFYLALSFYTGLIVLLAGMTKGVGLIVALPFLFFINHFAYLEMNQRGFSSSAPQ